MSTKATTLPRHDRAEESVKQTVANNLAAEVARKRMSGRDFAKMLGKGQMYVARRMAGEVELSASDILEFSGALRINPMVLLQTESLHQSPDGADVEPPAGIEPATYSLRVNRSTD